METVTLFAPQSVPTLSSVSVSYEDVLKHPEQYYQVKSLQYSLKILQDNKLKCFQQGFDIVWMLISSALVFIMIPALSLIYAGIGNRSFALTLFRLPLVTGAFVGLQVSLLNPNKTLWNTEGV
jgi:hypothetical protein